MKHFKVYNAKTENEVSFRDAIDVVRYIKSRNVTEYIVSNKNMFGDYVPIIYKIKGKHTINQFLKLPVCFKEII